MICEAEKSGQDDEAFGLGDEELPSDSDPEAERGRERPRPVAEQCSEDIRRSFRDVGISYLFTAPSPLRLAAHRSSCAELESITITITTRSPPRLVYTYIYIYIALLPAVAGRAG